MLTNKRRDILVQFARERLEATYLQAIRDGAWRPVIFLMQLTDPIAREVLYPLGASHLDVTYTSEWDELKPYVIACWPAEIEIAVSSLKDYSSRVARMLCDYLPEDDFPVVVIADGKITLSFLNTPLTN